MIDWNKYATELEKIKMIKAHDILADSEGVEFPPQDEIALRHELITPATFNGIDNKNLRAANLDTMEMLAIRKAGIFINWLDGVGTAYDMNENLNLSGLIDEVNQDANIILNSSVARGGKLLNDILNPKKRFSLVGERVEKRFGLFRKGGEQQQ